MWKIFESMLSRPPFCKSIGDLVNISVGKMSEKWIDQYWRDILTDVNWWE